MFNQMVHFEMMKAIVATVNLGNICREPLRLPFASDPPIVDRDDGDIGSTTEGGLSTGVVDATRLDARTIRKILG